MIKPESNAPSQMQQWVRTTDKQIEDLERSIARLQTLLAGSLGTDHEQNFALNNVFSFNRFDDGTVDTTSTGMRFIGDVVADTGVDVAGVLTVGNPTRQLLNDDGEVIGLIPNFEMTAGQYEVNPVTGDGNYSPGRLHMTDSALDLSVNGVIAGDGLSIALSNTNQVAQTPVAIISVVGDGTNAVYEIAKTDATLASYVAGKYATVTGVDPSGYNIDGVIISAIDSSGANLKFTAANTTSASYVAGGYATISQFTEAYNGQLSVQGVGPDFAGITVNQDGVYAGNDAGNPATATAYVTPTTLKAPEVAGDYLKVNGTKVSVSATAPSSPANGDLWIDPSGSSAASSLTGSVVAQSLRCSYASAAARDAAILTPVEGMLCYLEDLNHVTAYLGSAWFPIAGQMPFFDVLKTANQTGVVSSSITLVTWPTAITNRGGFTVASNAVTVPYTGMYTINTALNFDSANTAGNNRHTLIYVNGTAVTRDQSWPGTTVDAATRSVWKGLLNANDVVDVRAYQTSGINMSIISTRTRLTISYDGP
ncbi:hypothetical protein UFOVP536_23 [uncultured Caudovirales phage]|uniref:Uncharacterized protein n=1 Tax=uncultured Caudovirales phage TaxID=2100421 RepID=A0A6J5MUH6_9CAUD|nr:hypothetical protein UFOVP536_23 [uncultured Caudovirales phage]